MAPHSVIIIFSVNKR